jgi:hypothetical protein
MASGQPAQTHSAPRRRAGNRPTSSSPQRSRRALQHGG